LRNTYYFIDVAMLLSFLIAFFTGLIKEEA